MNKYRVSLGRASKNDAVIRDPSDSKMVSAQHAVFVNLGNSAIVIDTSLNGTYVNSRRIQRSVLRPNDTIRFGKSSTGETSNISYVFQIKPNTSNAITDADIYPGAESIKTALTCTLCKEYLVFPSEVSPCGHFFCSSCITSFTLRNPANDCPECSTALTTYKCKTSFNLVSLFQQILKMVLSPTEYVRYTERCSVEKALLVDRQRALSNLKAKHDSVTYSPRTGDPFLMISQSWTEYEKHKFRIGIAKHPIGEAREFYCWMVRLTEHWVLYDANETDLSVVLFNLDLMQDGPTARSADKCRDAIIRFIYGKAQNA